MWWLVIDILVGIAGFIVGRWYERHVIYARLLSSTDPQAWKAAHSVQTGRMAAQHDEESDVYPPTPSKQFPALEPTRKQHPPG